MAFLIDTLIQVIVYTVLAIIAGVTITAFSIASPSAFGSKWALALMILSSFATYWGYFAIFESVWQGQTPGKRYVGIRVVKDSGRGITTGEAMSRNFLRAVDGLPAMYIFGLITMLLSKEKKRIGDYVAGTIVVHEKAADERDLTFAKLEDAPAVQDWALTLTTQDLELIESYLQRRYTFEPGARYVTGSRIVEHIQKKSGSAKESGETDDDFLQRMAATIRNRRS